MVSPRSAAWGAWWAGAVVLAALAAGSTCKVANEAHCANQDVPGNEYCRELNVATPYCSPCNRNYHGCVAFEPYACGGYPNEVLTEGDGLTTGGTASGTASDTGETLGSGSGSAESGAGTAASSG